MRGVSNRGYYDDESDLQGPSCDYPLPYCTRHSHHLEPSQARVHTTSRLQPLDAANLRLSSVATLSSPSNRLSQPPSYPAACIDSPPAYTPHPFQYQQYQREPRYIRPNQAAYPRYAHRQRNERVEAGFSRSMWRNKRLMYVSVILFLVLPIVFMFVIMAGVGVL